eukprot:CAMPEP_0183381646 /NCGR_PEP_ID=MMETSP0164_2-20130417/126544_1 /TAXON_ID=221442 /ORGANISM="Coccolithus pelagicus ssp braarudi, Strain PLY182g" /LENGTH=58 /DNA_ID=CAMNT_0025559257 /DNA_START=45 /DNA_END=221 /DNA_ORIENTATION=-
MKRSSSIISHAATFQITHYGPKAPPRTLDAMGFHMPQVQTSPLRAPPQQHAQKRAVRI